MRAYLVVTRGGLEPPMRESKSLVLPLHYRVIFKKNTLQQVFVVKNPIFPVNPVALHPYLRMLRIWHI